MSYSRFYDADAYIYDSVSDGLVCQLCSLLKNKESSTFIAGSDYDKMLEHIKEHRLAGDYIPEYADEDLKRDRDEFKANTGKE